ncbi:uncharacterized protein LY79DRAFT_664314 [Colletotrichum navitas]|uniref:Ankyrin repeat protein n=1 Tax=Colletotrichum navitas TaxID=681940 RepID=A0AAD8PI76_9PEZI|nr:uncharacterized protein LY79DRAFT_664314 [Colletotrichum navitas]KAK1561435.1 hypothetical protein LY79DRAFT_664314 [Colletotrichum navitas]
MMISRAVNALAAVSPRRWRWLKPSKGNPRTSGARLCGGSNQSYATSSTGSGKCETLETILSAAEEKRELCIRKQWKIKKRNGDVIILRDIFEMIVQCVNKSKILGDAAASIAPQYATLPWGVVVILLQTGINDTEAFAAMIDGLEAVTSIIATCAVFESVYLSQRTLAISHLESSLTALYGAILTFLGTAFRYFSQSTGKGFFKAVVNPAKEIEDAMKRVESKQTEVERTAQVTIMEIQTHTSTRVQDLTSMVSSLAVQLEMANSKLASLSGHSEAAMMQRGESLSVAITFIMRPKQRTIRQPERFDNLKVEDRIIRYDWLSSVRYKFHHLTETRGRMVESGKWLFQRPEFLFWTDSSISGTLWLHGPPGCGKTKLASAVIDFDRARAKAQADSAVPIAYFYCNSGDGERTKPDEVLRCIARQLCGDDPESPVTEELRHAYETARDPQIGQNKLSINEAKDLILGRLSENPATILWDCLNSIVKDAPNLVKVFLTSRDDGDIVCRLSSTPNIYISVQDNSTDIERFVELELSKAISQKRLLRGLVSEQLRSQIAAALKEGSQGMQMKLEDDILHELRQLPRSLSDLYAISFDQILQLSSSSYGLAISILQLMLVAVRPIAWGEILHILQVSHTAVGGGITRDVLLDITCNFIADDGQWYPRLVHHSVREYLRSRPEFASGVSNAEAARLLVCGADPNQTALSYYPSRAATMQRKMDPDAVLHIGRPATTPGFHVLSRTGRMEVQSPYFWKEEKYAIIHIAIHTLRAVECVKVLLQHGANVNTRSLNNQTTLESCLEYGNLQTMFEVFEILTKSNVEVDAKLQNDRTIAHVVAAMGHTELMIRLLDAGANCAVRDQFRQSPLDIARRYAHLDVVELLISRGAVAPVVEDIEDEAASPLPSGSGSQAGSDPPKTPYLSVSIQDCDTKEDMPTWSEQLHAQLDMAGGWPGDSAKSQLDVVKELHKQKSVGRSWETLMVSSGLKQS